MNRDEKYEPSRFRKWIDWYGHNELARAMGVGQRTVSYWAEGQTAPRAKYFIDLIKLSEGKLTLEDIAEGIEHEKAHRAHREKIRKKPK